MYDVTKYNLNIKMNKHLNSAIWVSVGVLFFCNTVTTQNVSITIPLNRSLTFADKELYGEYYYLNRSTTLEVSLGTPFKNVSFIVFQVHSHLYNIVLYNNSYVKGSYVNSTNAALYGTAKPFDTYFIWNPNEVDLKIYISIHGYGPKDPIPGGCNMEFPQPIAPYLHTEYTKDFIYVDAAAARDPSDKDCLSMIDAIVVFYRIYLPERDFSEDTYFENIRNMLTMEKIEETAYVIPSDAVWRMRRMLSAYPGTGSLYVAIAYSTVSKAYSVYSPVYTYACSPLDDDCDLIGDDFLSQFLCASLLFIGLFVCFFGHKYFKTEMYLSGLLTGFILTYILISIVSNVEPPALTVASAICGVFFGAIWLLFWWLYGIPFFAVLLPTFNLGFLFAAIVYYRLPAGLTLLQSDMNFWPVFIVIMLLTAVFFISMTFLTNILCCAILGGYAAVYPIDYYLGSNLKYILINSVRRATVPKFGRAVMAPVFQKQDALLTFTWIGLSLSGFLYQHYQNRNRPPFPPPPRSISARMPGDTSAVTVRGRSRRYGTAGSSRQIDDSVPSAPTEFPAATEGTPLLA